MIIKNTSPYKDESIRSLFYDVYNELKKTYGNLTFHGLTIDQFKIQIRNKFVGYSGCCFLGDMMGEGKIDAKQWNFNHSGANRHLHCSISRTCNLTEIVQLFGHEFLHAYGLDHKEFPNAFKKGWEDPMSKDFIKYCELQYIDKYQLLKRR